MAGWPVAVVLREMVASYHEGTTVGSFRNEVNRDGDGGDDAQSPMLVELPIDLHARVDRRSGLVRYRGTRGRSGAQPNGER